MPAAKNSLSRGTTAASALTCSVPSPRWSTQVDRPALTRAPPQTPRWHSWRANRCRQIRSGPRHTSSSPRSSACPKVPADLEAGLGYHVDHKNPGNTAQVVGYRHHKTTDLHTDLGRERPLGNTTHAAGAHEGSQFITHREAIAVPVRPGQMPLGDAAYDVTKHDQWWHDHGALAVFD
jgi:hypothetical protein